MPNPSTDPNKPLTPRQDAFVDEYLVDMVGSKAVVRAGYKAKHPEKYAYELLKKPNVALAIKKRMAKREESTGVSPEFVINKIANTIHKAELDAKYNEVLRGCELLGRHMGMFVDRTEVTGKDGEAIQYERNQQDAASFTSSVTSLAERARKAGKAGGNE